MSKIHIRLELIWWVFTILLVVGVVYPIVNTLEVYPFYLINIIYVITFVTLARYTFLLKFTFLPKHQVLKQVFIFSCIPFVFYLVQELNQFQTFLDEEGWDGIVGQLPYGQRNSMINYIRSEMILFGVGSIISAVVFAFRLILSVWRMRNRGEA